MPLNVGSHSKKDRDKSRLKSQGGFNVIRYLFKVYWHTSYFISHFTMIDNCCTFIFRVSSNKSLQRRRQAFFKRKEFAPCRSKFFPLKEAPEESLKIISSRQYISHLKRCFMFGASDTNLVCLP